MSSVFLPDVSVIGNYRLKRQIGKGSFASVWLAEHLIVHINVAIKVIAKKSINTDESRIRFHREVALLKKMDHPYISQFFEYIEDEENYFLVIEFAEKGNMLEFVNEFGKLSEVTARKYFFQLVSVIEYLHDVLHVAHRDLKAENVLLDRNSNIRLIDFGLSNQFAVESPQLNTACGSPAYAAPEMIKGQPYTKSADIWSAGILLYAFVVGQLPYDDDNVQRLLQKIVYTEVTYPTYISSPLNDLLRKMLSKNPDIRITLPKIKNHYWFSQNEYASMVLPSCMNSSGGEVVIDREVTDKMIELGVDCRQLSQSLILGEHNSLTAIYKILRKNKVTDTMNLAETPSTGLPMLDPNHSKQKSEQIPLSGVNPMSYTVKSMKEPTPKTLKPFSIPAVNQTPGSSKQMQVPQPVAVGSRRMSRPVAVRRSLDISPTTIQSNETP